MKTKMEVGKLALIGLYHQTFVESRFVFLMRTNDKVAGGALGAALVGEFGSPFSALRQVRSELSDGYGNIVEIAAKLLHIDKNLAQSIHDSHRSGSKAAPVIAMLLLTGSF